jgi:phosphoesterase RecJ-like protein
MNSGIEKVIGAIESGKNFLVLGHKDPDGDSLGSMLALSNFLRQQAGKFTYIPAPENWPAKYLFLEKHKNGAGLPAPEDIDTIVILDCSTDDRIDWGSLDRHLFDNAKKVVIDHHKEGEPFGNINWIDPEAAAAGEMVFDILDSLGAHFTTDISESLYSAILTDTGRFSFSNTTSRSLDICARLVKEGELDPANISARIYFNFSEDYLRNIGIALYNTRVYCDSKILFLTLDKASVRSFSTTFSDTEGIVDLAMGVKGVEVAALFKEIRRNIIRVSLRSRSSIDIGSLASELGGGGHHNAAGCTLEMPLSLAREVILDRFEKLLSDNGKKGESNLVG